MRKPPLSMISAVVASLFSSNSRSASSRHWTSSSISWGRVAMSCVLRRALADKLVQQHACDHVERFKHALAFVSDGGKGRDLQIPVIEQKLHILNRRHVRQISLVVLQHVGNVSQVQFERF